MNRKKREAAKKSWENRKAQRAAHKERTLLLQEERETKIQKYIQQDPVTTKSSSPLRFATIRAGSFKQEESSTGKPPQKSSSTSTNGQMKTACNSSLATGDMFTVAGQFRSNEAR